MRKNNGFLFSFVIYASNDDYKKTVESIISQSAGFEKNVQLIISFSKDVGDKKYIEALQSRFQDNITVLGECDNIMEAYRRSKPLVSAEYVNYAECGSVYGENTLTEVKASFEQNGSAVNVVLANSDSEAANGNTLLLSESLPADADAVDLMDSFQIPLIFFNYCFIKGEITLNFSFDISIEELFICRVMIEMFECAPAFAITKQPLVIPYPSKNFCMRLFAEYRENNSLFKVYKESFMEKLLDRYSGELMPIYVQYNMLMFSEWCAVEPFAKEVAERAYSSEEFLALLTRFIKEVDDRVIRTDKRLQFAHKLFFFRLKYGDAANIILMPSDKRLYFGNTRLSLLSNNTTRIEFVELHRDKVKFHIRAKFFGCGKEGFGMYALADGREKFECKNIGRDFDTICWGEPVYEGMTFELEIDLQNMKRRRKIELYCVQNGYVAKRNNISFEKFSPLSSLVPHCYYYKNGRILSYDRETSVITVEKANGFKAFGRELRYLASLLLTPNDYAKHAFLARIYYRFLKLVHRKPIWLISDRTDRGDDNGEAFIKYLNSINEKKADYYFVIDKNCDEGRRISKFAKTISPNSKKHKFYHLLAEYIISSQGNVPVVNPFQGGNIFYRDILCNMKFVFLQHGVTKDNQSAWLTLYNRNMYGFVVTTHQEYKSCFDYDYFYSEDRIWLTGMPRLDLLYHDEKKYITFMPTWRKYLMKPNADPVTGMWILRDDLGENEFCSFYNSLFNDERLLSAAKEYGYTLCFKPHPIIEPYIDKMFDLNDNIRLLKSDTAYREVFAQSDLMLTDFSSAVFDFAYLRKPIIYMHFDLATFRAGGHSYTEGYFDYERDGFGEVTYNLDETVECIIDYMKNDCKPKERYLERINKTFAFNDKDCCKRIYERLTDRNGE